MFTAPQSSVDSVWPRLLAIVLKSEHSLVQWLARDYHRRNLHNAVSVAFARFERERPEWVKSLFDDYFVYRHLLPMFISASEAGVLVTTDHVADEYVDQVFVHPNARERFRTQVLPAADYFLRLVVTALDEARMTTPYIRIQSAQQDLIFLR